MAHDIRRGRNRIVLCVLLLAWLGPREGAARQLEAIAVVEDCTIPGPAALEQINLEEDVAYGAAGPAQTLDVAWPLEAGRYPLVVLIHGGAWQSGDKRDLRNDMLRLARIGYVAVSMNYRLAPDHVFPAALHDVQCAVHRLQTEADRYAIDPKQTLLIGASAGGHLAALAAATAHHPALEPSCPDPGDAAPQINGVVAYYTPTDLRNPAVFGTLEANALTQFLGQSPQDNPALAALASPVVQVGGDAPPMLMVHGEADTRIPFKQSEALKEALWGAGVPATVVGLPGIQHGFPIFAGTDALRPGACTALAFLNYVVTLDAEAPEPPAAHRLAWTPPFPNPTAHAVQVGLHLEVPTPVQVGVYDALGRRVALVYEGLLTSGAHTFRMDTSNWPAGMYWVRVVGGGLAEARAFIRR